MAKDNRRPVKPHHPVPYNAEILAAIKAWQAGVASQGQQQLTFRWVIEVAAGTYDQPYRADTDNEGGPRATDFACGRMFVGQQIVKMTKIVPT